MPHLDRVHVAAVEDGDCEKEEDEAETETHEAAPCEGVRPDLLPVGSRRININGNRGRREVGHRVAIRTHVMPGNTHISSFTA